MALLARADHVEERVVDADGHADQQDDRLDAVVERKRLADRPEQAERRGDRGQREQHRDERRDDRAERKQQDQQRHRDESSSARWRSLERECCAALAGCRSASIVEPGCAGARPRARPERARARRRPGVTSERRVPVGRVLASSPRRRAAASSAPRRPRSPPERGSSTRACRCGGTRTRAARPARSSRRARVAARGLADGAVRATRPVAPPARERDDEASQRPIAATGPPGAPGDRSACGRPKIFKKK